jgi:hypothetical protein
LFRTVPVEHATAEQIAEMVRTGSVSDWVPRKFAKTPIFVQSCSVRAHREMNKNAKKRLKRAKNTQNAHSCYSLFQALALLVKRNREIDANWDNAEVRPLGRA